MPESWEVSTHWPLHNNWCDFSAVFIFPDGLGDKRCLKIFEKMAPDALIAKKFPLTRTLEIKSAAGADSEEEPEEDAQIVAEDKAVVATPVKKPRVAPVGTPPQPINDKVVEVQKSLEVLAAPIVDKPPGCGVTFSAPPAASVVAASGADGIEDKAADKKD